MTTVLDHDDRRRMNIFAELRAAKADIDSIWFDAIKHHQDYMVNPYTFHSQPSYRLFLTSTTSDVTARSSTILNRMQYHTYLDEMQRVVEGKLLASDMINRLELLGLKIAITHMEMVTIISSNPWNETDIPE